MYTEGIEIGDSRSIDNGDENTLCDDRSERESLKKGKMNGKIMKRAKAMDTNENDDARTIASLGSTLVEGAETGQVLANDYVNLSFILPPYHQLIPSRADWEWTMFCINGFR